jgi:hypothetical protein
MGRSLIILMLISAFAFADQKHVTVAGAGGHNGTSESDAWSLGEALANVATDDTVNIHTGTYATVMRMEHSGTNAEPIVWRRHGNDLVTITGVSDDSYKDVVFDCSYNHIIGLSILDAEVDEDARTWDNDHLYLVEILGQHNKVDSCRLERTGDTHTYHDVTYGRVRGIVLDGRYNTVSNTFIRGMVNGIVTACATEAGATPRNNIIRKDTIYSTYFTGIILGGSTAASPGMIGTLVESCRIDTSIGEDAIQLEHAGYQWTQNRGYIIRYNYLANCGENAVDVKHSGHIYVYGNIMHTADGDDDGPYWAEGEYYSDGTSGKNWHSGTLTGVGDWTDPVWYCIWRDNIMWDGPGGLTGWNGDHFVNNTSINHQRKLGTPNTVDTTDYGLQNVFMTNGSVILNNIIGGGNGYFQTLWMSGVPGTIDYNIYYDTTTGQTATNARFAHRSLGVYPTKVWGITAWKAAMQVSANYSNILGKEVNSQFINPKFVTAPIRATDGNDTKWDWTLASDSPAKGAGRAWTFATESGTSDEFQVVDAYFFHDGMGVTGGDSIQLGSNSPTLITAINYATNTIVCSDVQTWSAGDSVWLYTNGAKETNIGATISGITSSGTTVTIPDTTTHVSPSDGSTSSSPVTFKWRTVSGATKYYFDCSINDWAVNSFYANPNVTDTSIIVSGFSEGDIVHWNVSAGNTAGGSAFTKAWHTTITAGGVAGNDTISWNAVSDTLELTGDTKVYFKDLKRRDMMILVRNPSGYGLTFDSAIKWPISGPPSMSNNTDALIFLYRNGSTVYGFLFGVYTH